MISKPLAQPILCLSHRGSATTLSVVLNSYLFAVSASAITAFLSLITWQSPIPLTRHMETTQFLLPVSVRVQPFTVRISCYFPDICIQLFAFFLRQRWRQGIPLKAHRLPATMHVSRSSKEVKLCFPASFLHITHIFLCIIVNLFSSSWFSLCFPKSYSRSLLSARQHTKSPFILASPQHRGSIWAVENSPWLIQNLPRIIRCIWYHCQCCPIWQRELHCTWPTACHLLRACELGVSKGWGAPVP